MKLLLLLSCIFLNSYVCYCQDTKRLMQEYDTAKNTNSKVDLFFKYYSGSKDSISEKIVSIIQLSEQFKKKNDMTGMGVSNLMIGYEYIFTGDYTNSLRYGFYALKNFGDAKDSLGIMHCLSAIGNSYVFSKNFEQALIYLKKGATLEREYSGGSRYADDLNAIAYCMIMLKKPDSAFAYVKPAVDIGFREKDTFSLAYYIGTFGEAYLASKDYDSAKTLIVQSFKYAKQLDLKDLLGVNSNDLSQLFYETGMFDSSVYYARQGVYYSSSQAYLLDSYEWLYKAYEKQDQKDSVSKYFRLAVTLRDSIFSVEKNKTIQTFNFQEQLWEKERQQEITQAKKDYNDKLILYCISTVLAAVIIISAIQYRNNKLKQKANLLLQSEKLTVESTLSELKSTQAQLIQSEKMASLGELTAGIAHEIQNPLNFVNNFSDVNTELVDEASQEIERGNITEVKALLNDIKENEQKINHHGKRADAIVKGMLQHSRTSSGQKESTDINKLADEYLRLAYHGLRAKDKSFNAIIETDFDNSIGKINIIPQDIGRVLLNLYNNAFYAVGERQKVEGIGFEPTVTISTASIQPPSGGRSVQIKVADNGGGISQKILDKIFQPFFTTKPTGQGTGLGLSLAYDIIKTHGGEIKVETKEGEGVEFIIQLPII